MPQNNNNATTSDLFHKMELGYMGLRHIYILFQKLKDWLKEDKSKFT